MSASGCRIHKEFATKLVGLRMAVPEYWWRGYNAQTLCPGEIAAVDFSQEGGRYFQLMLDDTPGVLYPMRYDAVVLYSDTTHASHSSFVLPATAPQDPALEESVTVPAPKKRSRQPNFSSAGPGRARSSSTANATNAQQKNNNGKKRKNKGKGSKKKNKKGGRLPSSQSKY